MTELHLAIEAARLLGRWTLIADKHANGCSCCPGLGDGASFIALLKDCIARSGPAGADVLQPLFTDLDEALGHLERIQRGP